MEYLQDVVVWKFLASRQESLGCDNLWVWCGETLEMGGRRLARASASRPSLALLENVCKAPSLCDHEGVNHPVVYHIIQNFLMDSKLACPELPPELWSHILENVNPGPLWMLRRTSRWFKDLIEHDFRRIHLPDFEVHFNIQVGPGFVENADLLGRKFFIATRFSHFDEADDSIAVFEEEEEQSPKGSSSKDFLDRVRAWKECVGLYPGPEPDSTGDVKGRPDAVPWRIVFRGRIVDSDLPGHSIDFENGKLRFHWKGAMTAFFREADYMQRKSLEAVSTYHGHVRSGLSRKHQFCRHCSGSKQSLLHLHGLLIE
jgi:hypothetical protein